MKTALSTLFVITFFFMLTGCASVSFYSKPDLTGKTGLRFYTVKPYLLVEFHAEKDNTVKTSVVYLPDLVNPQYIILKPGIGSNELKLAFTNSSLNSYGLISDTHIPETINSLAGLLSKSSDAVTQLVKSERTEIQPVSSENFKLYEIVFGIAGTTLKEVTESAK